MHHCIDALFWKARILEGVSYIDSPTTLTVPRMMGNVDGKETKSFMEIHDSEMVPVKTSAEAFMSHVKVPGGTFKHRDHSVELSHTEHARGVWVYAKKGDRAKHLLAYFSKQTAIDLADKLSAKDPEGRERELRQILVAAVGRQLVDLCIDRVHPGGFEALLISPRYFERVLAEKR